MTIPFWCLLIGCLLPYTWLFFTAKQRKELPEGFDNQNPRTQVTKLTGAAAWAMGAHNNALEAIPIFASGVIVNHILGADPATATKLSVAWVVCRVLHGVFYITGLHALRSTAFFVAFACAIGLFVVAA